MKGLLTQTLNFYFSSLLRLGDGGAEGASFYKVVRGDFYKAGAVQQGIAGAAHALAESAAGHKLMQ